MEGDTFEFPFEDSMLDAEEEIYEPEQPTWRRGVLITTALLVAASLILVPIYNVLVTDDNVADNGLEVCGFDYCVVNDAVRAAGLELVQARLAASILDDSEAGQLKDHLVGLLAIEPIELRIVDDLEGRLGGFYDAESRTIVVARPANSWVILHEVAHAEARGHGAEFQTVLIDLARSFSIDS